MSPPVPLVETNSCNCTALRKASRRLSQLYDSALAPSGLKSTQFAILAEVDRRSNEPPTIRDLADALVMDPSTIGQNLRPLERDGLIVLDEAAEDRRRRHVKVTRKGRSLLASARPLWSEAQARFENSFGKPEAAALRAVLIKIARDPTLMAEGETPLSDL